ncbi:MAG TPA: biopolymer transporter ExbD [Pseudomonadales bacterium]|nr:biopolymer transporter ExbD [Pseudomonadales bacterium]
MSFGSPSNNDDDTEMSDINMTPLIDVMLVLLIIFIVTLPVITHTVQIDLPKVNNQPNNTKPNIVTLSVDKAGQIYWDDSPINNADLDARLLASSQENPQPEIQIRGDKKVEYEHVVKIMNAVQRAGLVKIGFVTEPENN